MSKKTEKLTLPSLLSFERKLELSDGLMFSGVMNNIEKKNVEIKVDGKETTKVIYWKPVEIKPRKNRSTQSAEGTKEYDQTQPNPVSSDNDDANLFSNDDTLKLTFSLRVIGNLGDPFASNNPAFERAITNKISQVKKDNPDVVNTLAFRYAYNIANGRFLWRNRVGAEEITIIVGSNGSDDFLKFSAYDFSLNDFDKTKDDSDLLKLAQLIESGLLAVGDDKFTFITVQAFVKLGNGQHVFPSEEMNMGEKKKTLFKLENGAAIHNVKIGNAVRTIDTWYGDTVLVATTDKKTNKISIEGEIKKPIAIEPFGSVTQRGAAFRSDKNRLVYFDDELGE